MDDTNRMVAEGVASLAYGLSGMGEASDDEAHDTLVIGMTQKGVLTPEVARYAANFLRRLLPPDETVEEIERAAPIRDMLGVTSAAEDMAVTLRACAWLDEIAAS